LQARCVGVDPVTVIADTNRRELHHVHASASLYPGALELLHAIRNEGHVIATATNAPRDYFDAVLDGHGLRALVDVPMCLGDGFADKSAMVARAIQESESRPAVVIGDRQDDIVAAHANGAFAIGARYGYGADGELADADAVIESLADLPAALVRILTRTN
jgi:phosphoglycolate phosphatase